VTRKGFEIFGILLSASLILANIFSAFIYTGDNATKAFATDLNSSDLPIGSTIIQHKAIASSTGTINNNVTILAPRTDAIYSGTISWTASRPVELYVLHAYPIDTGQTVNGMFGQPLTITVNNHLYAAADVVDSSSGQVESAVFSGNALLLVSSSGTFVAEYTLRATVDTATIVSDFSNAIPASTNQKIVGNNTKANVTRTINTSSFSVRWSAQMGEQIESLKWSGLPGQEMARGAAFSSPLMQCASQLWGDSWAAPDPQTGGKVLVGYATPPGFFESSGNTVTLNGTSVGCSPTSQLLHPIGIRDTYQFFNSGPQANIIKVTREFDFGNSNATIFPQGIFRPYIPRLDASRFSEVLYPTTTGANAGRGNIADLTVGPSNPLYCKFGCMADNWNGGWFALRDPTTQAGVIVKHDYSVDQSGNSLRSKLWIDWDDPAQTATSIVLVQPDDGLSGKVTEAESLCFFNRSTWNASSSVLPDGC